MKTAEEFINRGLDDSGFELSGQQLKIISRNVKEYAKQLLEEYTNRIVENIKHIDVGEIGEDGNHYPYYIVDKKSITSQLPKFLKEKGI
jgi:hypothetical protein